MDSPLDNSLNASFNASKRRISLNRSDYRLGSIATHKKMTEDNLDDSSKEVVEEQFHITLNSLQEINSKAFNPNQAFNYNFINIINTFINTNKIDFKIVAASLDAGTKLYMSKVEFIYNNTQKISSSLSMATEEHDVNCDLELDQTEKPKRKKVKKNTIVTNIDSLNSKLETNIEIDPLFYYLKAAFDVGNVSSLLMSNLVSNPQGVLLLDSNANLNFDSLPNMENKIVTCPLIKEEFVTKRAFVCHPFSNFEFLRRDIDIDMENFTEEINVHTADINTEELNFDYNFDRDDQNLNDLNDINDDDYSDVCSPNTAQATRNSLENEQNVTTKTLNKSLNVDYDIFKLLPDDNENNVFFNRNFLRNTFKNKIHYRNLKQSSAKPTRRRVRVTYSENSYSNVKENLFKLCNDYYIPQHSIKKWPINILPTRQDDMIMDPRWRTFSVYFTEEAEIYPLRRKFKKEIIKAPIETNNNGDDDDYPTDIFDDFPTARYEDIRADNVIENPLNLDTNTDNLDLNSHVEALNIDYAKVSVKINIKHVKAKMWDIIKSNETQTLNNIDFSSPDTEVC